MTQTCDDLEKDDLKQQAEQARRMLMRIQWFVIVLLASGIVWLYVAFESVVGRVDEKLVKIDNVDTRLNNIDDRLFALTPADSRPPKTDQVSRDGELIRVQLALVNQLFEQGNYVDTLTALEAIRWQLSQLDGVASPIKSTLSEKLQADIDYVTALKNQPDAWQAHIVKMRDLQAFLRSQQTYANTLNRSDVLLHDATMLLSLAIGAATLRDRDLMTGYLNEALSQLESQIILTGGRIDIVKQEKPAPKKLEPRATINQQGESADPQAPLKTLNDAVYWFYELLANSPKDKGLQSVQILKN